jgi:ribosomal protein S18 acetylase RimI-like enzyme
MEVRPRRDEDDEYVRRSLAELLAGTSAARRGALIDALPLPGLIAEVDGSPVGLLTYDPAGADWEVVTIGSTRPGIGAGGALLDAVRARAAAAGARRVWLITTNDNTGALRFYQRRGFDLVALYRDAVTRSRRDLKPAIPATADGIPIRHELELEWRPPSGGDQP